MSVSQAPSPLSASPASLLYRDLVCCIYPFLLFADAITAHASCRLWRDALHRAPSLGSAVLCRIEGLEWRSASPLRRHVRSWTNRRLMGSIPESLVSSLEQFAWIRALSEVTQIKVNINREVFAPVAAAAAAEAPSSAQQLALLWPRSLRTLDVFLVVVKPNENRRGFEEESEASTVCAQALIDSCASLPALTTLRFILPTGAASLHKLRGMSSLTSLEINHVSAADFDVLKQLCTLRRLIFTNEVVPSVSVLRLCKQPHSLSHLRFLNMKNNELVSAEAEALLHLPALINLQVDAVAPDAVPVLRRFDRLRSLYIGHRQTRPLDYTIDCPALTELTLDQMSVSSDRLQQLASDLGQTLRLLHFSNCIFVHQGDSLGCLRPMRLLRSLQFLSCKGLSHACFDSDFCSALPNLRCLLLPVIQMPDDEVDLAALFAVPCRAMPQLTASRSGGSSFIHDHHWAEEAEDKPVEAPE